MARIELQELRKRLGTQEVLKGLALTIEDGEYAVIVGPSGCGKSTLLRVIAGLESADAGRLLIGGRDLTDAPPSQRGLAMVFQSYALYPHMNLFDNMAFGLKLAKVPTAEIQQAVTKAAKMLHIEHLLERKPKDLSGGQRQRVAIGRAIVRQPEVFLFDEPLSNLDTALRVKMRYEFAKLHEQFKTTMVYVTHDQVEAMTLADRIVVLQAGRIEQVLDVQRLRRLGDGFLDLCLGHLRQLEPEGHVVVQVHVRIQRVALEHHRDAALGRGQVVDDTAADGQLAFGDVFQPGDGAQQRALAAAAGPHEDHELAVVDVQVDPLQDLRVAVGLADPGQLHFGHGLVSGFATADESVTNIQAHNPASQRATGTDPRA